MRNLKLSYKSIGSCGIKDASSIFTRFQTATGTCFTLINDGTILMEDHLINSVKKPISGAHYSPSEDNLLISTTDGSLLLWKEDQNSIESIGCWEDGIEVMKVSPDGEVIACITGGGKLFLLERNDSFEIINDHSGYSLCGAIEQQIKHNNQGLNKEGHGSQSLGWGSIETQFQGPKKSGNSGSVAAKLQKPQKVQSPISYMQWSPTSTHIVVAPIACSEKIIINNKGHYEGILVEDCEWRSPITQSPSSCSPNPPILAWSPRPEEAAPITVISPGQSPTGHIVRLYEINGLSHGEFALQRPCPSANAANISKMSYNSDGSLLCIEWSDSHVQLWHRSNYEWYLKAELEGDGFAFSSTNPERFTIIIIGTVYDVSLSYQCDYRREGEVCHVINGTKLCLTAISKEVLPPPLYRTSIDLPESSSTPVSLLFLEQKQLLVTSDYKGFISIFETTNTTRLLKTISLDHRRVLNVLHYSDSSIIYADIDGRSFSFSDGISSPVITNDDDDDDDLVKYEKNKQNEIHLDKERDLLLVGGAVVLEACNSFLHIKKDGISLLLGMDTMGYLHSIIIGGGNGVNGGGGNNQNNNNQQQQLQQNIKHKHLPPRLVEKGAVLLLYRQSDLAILCQTLPRGNLELLRIRSTLLSIELPSFIRKKQYAAALLLCRRHRLDYNLIYDLSPSQFVSELPRTVETLDRMDLLVHFITSLNVDECSLQKWKEYLALNFGQMSTTSTITTTTKLHKQKQDKKKHLLVEIRTTLLKSGKPDTTEALITTFLLQQKPDIRGALQLLLRNEFTEQEKEMHLQYIMYLAPHDQVWLEALKAFPPSIALPMALSISRRFQTQSVGGGGGGGAHSQSECEQVVIGWMTSDFSDDKELRHSIQHYINCHLEAALALDDVADADRIYKYVDVWNIEREWISRKLLEPDTPLKRKIFVLLATKYYNVPSSSSCSSSAVYQTAPPWIVADLLALGGQRQLALQALKNASLIDRFFTLWREGDHPLFSCGGGDDDVHSVYELMVLGCCGFDGGCGGGFSNNKKFLKENDQTTTTTTTNRFLKLAVKGCIDAWIPAIRVAATTGKTLEILKELEQEALLIEQTILEKAEEYTSASERFTSLTVLLIEAIKESLLVHQTAMDSSTTSSLPGRINQYCREDIPMHQQSSSSSNTENNDDALSVQSGTWSMNSLLTGIMSISSYTSGGSSFSGSINSGSGSSSSGKDKKERRRLERQRQRGKANGPWERHSLRDKIGQLRKEFHTTLGERCLKIVEALSLMSAAVVLDDKEKRRCFELERLLLTTYDSVITSTINPSFREARALTTELTALLRSYNVLTGVFGRLSGEMLLSPLPLPLQLDSKWREVFCLGEFGDPPLVGDDFVLIDIPTLKGNFEYL